MKNRVFYDAMCLEVEEQPSVAVTISTFPSVGFLDGGTVSAAEDEQCRFSRGFGRWTLQGDCELSAALELPANVTLDGDGHTISLHGDAEGFESAAIRSTGGDVVNLTVDGSGLLAAAPAYFAAIALAAPGRITRTTVRNIQFAGAPHSAIGIEIAAFDRRNSVAQDITVENISGAGLLLTGDSSITADRL
jgi:hypothetical protein